MHTEGEDDILVSPAKVGNFLSLLTSEKCDNDVLFVLAEVCEEMVRSVMDSSCCLASMKDNRILETSDIHLMFKNLYGIDLPPPADAVRKPTQSQRPLGDTHLRKLGKIRAEVYGAQHNKIL